MTPPGAAFDELGGWAGVLGRLVDGRSLSDAEAESVMDQVFSGAATEAQTGALLVALRVKGESVDEITGFVRSMMAHAVALPVEGEPVDVVGTGGDRLRSINVSTIAALVTAGAGVPVCKHGNRAATSSVGTADVLEALGVAVDLGPSGVARCVGRAGIGFCFAPRYHPAMRFAGPVRRQLGVPTIFNFLGPLANPARVTRQLVGVSSPAMAPKMVGALAAGGCRRSMVVYADDGLDELSVTAPSTVLELRRAPDGEPDIREWRVEPAQLGLRPATMEELRGGDAAFNADVIRRVVNGEPGPRRDIGLLNAAAALVVAGRAGDLASGLQQAEASVDGGAAARALSLLVDVSREAAAEEAEA